MKVFILSLLKRIKVLNLKMFVRLFSLFLFITSCSSRDSHTAIDDTSIGSKSISFNLSIDSTEKWSAAYDSSAVNLKDSTGNYTIVVNDQKVDSVTFLQVEAWIDSMESLLKKPIGVRMIAMTDSNNVYPVTIYIKSESQKAWLMKKGSTTNQIFNPAQ